MAHIAKGQGDEDRMLYYLAESSISDLRAGTRSYSSLYDLALELFDRKDYDRATAYMGSTFDDAIRCKSVTRIPNSSSAVVKINEAVISNIAQQQKLMSRTIWLAGIFLIVLIAILWFVLWQHRRLQGSHEQLIRMSDLLREKHDELLKRTTISATSTTRWSIPTASRTAMSAIISTFRSIISSR